MNTLKLKTNLRCAACVESIRPVFDAAPEVKSWSANVEQPDKPLTVHGENITRNRVDELLHQKGYAVVGEVLPEEGPAPSAPAEKPTTYFPLLLILIYLLAAVGLAEVARGTFEMQRAMVHFMAGFFLVFSFFKMLDLPAFAQSYSSYDIVTRRWYTYGYLYPFIEAGLGAAYLAQYQLTITNIVTLVVMGVSTIGVAQSVLARRKIQCACLGTVFNLPMSSVTLVEDLLMVGMAATMLIMQ